MEWNDGCFQTLVAYEFSKLYKPPAWCLLTGCFCVTAFFLKQKNRVAFATQFQRSFMNLLRNAQFEELSAQDLLLTYALNSDYLLTLPIYVDWKKAAQSNAIIFRSHFFPGLLPDPYLCKELSLSDVPYFFLPYRRGYATERQKGLLLVEKLDYLQSKLLQNFFFALSKPLKKPGKWLNEVSQSFCPHMPNIHDLRCDCDLLLIITSCSPVIQSTRTL